MRAMLLLEQESHWKLTNRDDAACYFRFGPAVRFVLFKNGQPYVSHKVDRVFCALGKGNDGSGLVDMQRVVLFLGNSDVASFDMPVGVVWVAGEVEL